MIANIIQSALKEILNFLNDNRHYWAATEEEKKTLLKKSNLPKAIQSYLIEEEEKNLINEIATALNHLQKGKSIKTSKLAGSISKFLSQEIGEILDQLPLSFYSMGQDGKAEAIKKIELKNGEMYEVIKKHLTTTNYQEIISNINKLASLLGEDNFIIIQSPREISTQLRTQIRTTLQKETPLNYPIFQVNKKIIGGIRLFKNGVLQDYSWLTRVMKFISITN